ncbi:hypothetical protein BDV25DRAFT_138624 [Aspergillus avenaceus]|uniref:Uncharacterized protein n=1 Tax=Aspergillus avenaceus TaxID=36643 RepID=A0A5N6U0C1_ASPAV|nr:hypothetical protein BDV25DRAFT_138624 [Aspergillus avenaceus]
MAEDLLNLDIECHHPPSTTEQTVFNIPIQYLPPDSTTPRQAAQHYTFSSYIKTSEMTCKSEAEADFCASSGVWCSASLINSITEIYRCSLSSDSFKPHANYLKQFSTNKARRELKRLTVAYRVPVAAVFELYASEIYEACRGRTGTRVLLGSFGKGNLRLGILSLGGSLAQSVCGTDWAS